ncbi:MAG: IS3 family transposase [Clostridia bacterium]|nr:IS3 family transposase [Clostridia bacterium]
MKLKYRVIERFRSQYSVKSMCQMFEVSRSGYYAWRKRQGKPAKDQWLVDLIVECQRLCKQTYGIRRVRRWIQRQTGRLVNVKAILRVMRKLSVLSVVRRRRPYTRYKQAVHKYPNLLKRCFEQIQPNRFWVTDITYIPIPGRMLYMCAVLDLCGKVVLAWKIGSDMSSSLVTDTIREALQREKVTGGLALHSDQGSQYTSQAYFDLTKEYHVSPSISSPGCPYDNAAMENFFGILKTECLYRAHFSSRAEVEQLVTEYVDFYNFERISLKNGLTPVEFRSKAV